MGVCGYNFVIIYYNNMIGMLYSGKVMGNDNVGFFLYEMIYGLLNYVFVYGI